MAIKRTLAQMLPDISRHILLHKEYLAYNERLFMVHEGQLRREIEDSLRKELSTAAYIKAIQRVPSINLLVRIIDKLSRVYSEPVLRTTASASDQDLLSMYEEQACMTTKMASANRMYNLHRSAAIEPFIQDGMMHLRVQPANKFLFFTDDLVNPMHPTAYIKFMDITRNLPFTDRDGNRIQIDEIRQVQVYYIWSDDEFLICDSEGRARLDLMKQRELEGVNPLGRLPAVYINRSEFNLIPVPDTDTLENTVLIPKLLADLNYAVQFQSHSILVATDLNLPPEMQQNPDTIWQLTSTDEDKQGRFDAIHPKVDIKEVLELIKTTLAIWLESRNIQAGDMGQMSPGDAASGLARIIDESDATQDRQAQCIVFQDVEQDVWELIGLYHNYAADAGLIDERKKFSDDLRVSVRFGDQKPVTSDTEQINNVKEQINLGLMSREQAVQELRPNMSEDDVDAWFQEIDADAPEGAVMLDGPQLKSLIELLIAGGSGAVPKDSMQAILVNIFSISENAAAEIVKAFPDKALNVGQPGQAAAGNPGQTEGSPNPSGGGAATKANDSGAGSGARAGSEQPSKSGYPTKPA